MCVMMIVAMMPAVAMAEVSASTLTADDWGQVTVYEADRTTVIGTYNTMAAALQAAKTESVLECEANKLIAMGGDHPDVKCSITVNGNGATVVKYRNADNSATTGEATFTVDTYQLFKEDVTLVINELKNATVWCQRNTDYTFTLEMNNCDTNTAYNMGQRVYLNGASGENIVTINDCDFNTGASNCVIYSNAVGSVTVKDCTFTGINEPININTKAASGKMSVTVSGCTFTDCGQGTSVDTTWAAPVRIVNASNETATNVEVDNCKFVYNSGKVSANGDILIGDGREGKTSKDVDLKVTNTTAEVQVQYPGDRTESTNNAIKLSVAATETATFSTNGSKEEAEFPKKASITVGETTTEYATLEAAIAAADGGVVTLLQNIKLNTTINILDGKTVTLNLNGYNLNSEVSNDGKAAALIVIKPTGNLTIEGTGTLGFVAADPDLQEIPGYATNTITNEGTLTIENGVTITNGSNGGASYAVDDKGTFIMNGGALVGKSCALRVAKYNQDNVSFVMNGGTITAATPMWIQLPGSDSNVAPTITVTINNGTIQTTEEASADNSILYTYSFGNSYKNTTVNIKGGNFLGGTVSFGSGYKGDIENVTISGGKFAFVPGRWTSESFVDFTKAGAGITVNKDIYKFASGTYAYEVASKAPANSSGMNTWNKGTDGIYTESYVAPYIPSTPSAPTDNVTNSGSTTTDNASTNADLSGSTSTSNGTTTATVDKTTADKIVDKAVENKSTEVVIDATANTTTAANSTTVAQVTIPTETLGAIAEKTEADVTIKTDVAEVKMDNAAAAAVSEQAEGDTVKIIAEKVKEDATEVHFELKVVCSDGKVISDFKGGNVAVTVTLPKEMADKKVVCVYIDDNGHMSKVEGQKNADGTYTFVTGHFSTYAIMAEDEADAAIAAQTEAIKNIKIKLTSKQVKTKSGKKGIKITWTAAAGDKVLDGVEVFRSKEKNKGYGTKAFFTSTKGGNKGSYINTKSLKKGTRYYYKVRGYVLVNGEKVYTDYSTKAWRTFK